MGTQTSKFKEGVRCPVADPSYPHILSHGVDRNPPCGCFSCGEEKEPSEIDFHYRCITCDLEFHDECSYKYPRKIRHPYHSQHPLTLTVCEDETKFYLKICHWCERDLENEYYCCSLCGFCLDLYCMEKSPHPTIKDPKSHHHPLVFFPRPFYLPCDACGSVRVSEPVYTCFQCNYMVHESCTNFPRVIKITRHPHRLSYTPYSTTRNSICLICYKKVDIKYGHYSCNQDGCSYAAHSLCATDENIWDGNELEWEPEEAIETEDIEPFKKVGMDLIKYFCHEHHLRLQNYDVARDAGKQCEVCILHIDSRDFYHCVQCDFYLHEVCANLPRKIDHALHRHPLILKPSPSDKQQDCSTCDRCFSGFRYECCKNDCERGIFQVDIRCILVPDCFTHKSHEHPMFISTCSTSRHDIFCQSCKSRILGKSHLECTLCTFVLCYQCVTIPDEIYYKHDQHPLSLCYGEEEVDDTYWCEICEKEIDSTKWFYTCNKSCITIHRKCIFGTSVYMKPGFIFIRLDENLKVVCNNGNTRPICYDCNKHCPDSIYYKIQTISICSVNCLKNRDERNRARKLLQDRM